MTFCQYPSNSFCCSFAWAIAITVAQKNLLVSRLNNRFDGMLHYLISDGCHPQFPYFIRVLGFCDLYLHIGLRIPCTCFQFLCKFGYLYPLVVLELNNRHPIDTARRSLRLHRVPCKVKTRNLTEHIELGRHRLLIFRFYKHMIIPIFIVNVWRSRKRWCHFTWEHGDKLPVFR